MNPYLSILGYQGPNILLFLIFAMLYFQHYTNPNFYLAILIWQIASHLLNVVIKNTLRLPRPDINNSLSHSPDSIEVPTFSNYLTIHRKYGMPSGHAQAVWSELVFIALFFKNTRLTALAAGQTLLTMWQRYITRRHSIKQLAVGSFIGIAIGYLFYTLLLATGLTG